MKFRFGFVSNSSSSSYVIMAKLEDFEKYLSELNLTKEEFETLFKENTEYGTVNFEKLFGIDVVNITFSSSGGDLYDEKLDNLLSKIRNGEHVQHVSEY